MSDMPKLTVDELRAAAEKLVQAGVEVRATVRDLTLRALAQRELAENEIRDVLSAIAEGVSAGAGVRAEAVKGALGDALRGMDDALSHTAEAMQLAIGEVVSDVQAFRQQELEQGMADLKNLEALFLEVIGRVAEQTGGLVKQELQLMTEHGRRAGTDTGSRVRAVVDELAQRVRVAAHDAASAGKATARGIAARVGARASQKLGEIATRIGDKAEQLKQGR